MSHTFEVKNVSGNEADNEETSEETSSTDTDKEKTWDESKLKLIEYSLRNVRNDTLNMRNDKYMQKEADDGGFGASADGFDTASSVRSSPDEDIIGSGSEDEKFVIKGGIKTTDSLTRIANAWDSTVDFLKHPWASMHKESNSTDEKMKSNEVVPDSVNLTKNKTSSAWENTTHFAPDITNTVPGVVKCGGYRYEDGTRYIGDWNHKGQKHGLGHLLLADGTRYDGSFNNGLCSGLGVMQFSDGAKYEGEFMQGWFHGHGIFWRADGMKFEGEFRGGRIWGLGLVTFNDHTHGFPRNEGFFQDCRMVRKKKCSEVVQRAQKIALMARAQCDRG